MKRWKILTVIVVIISVCLISSYAAMGINSSVPRPRILDSRSSTQTRSAPAPVRSAPTGAAVGSAYASPSSLAPPPLDPNKVAAAVRAFPGLEQELTRVGRGSRNEVTEWLRPISATSDNRSRLAKEVQKQVAIELAFLRKMALQEGARKTAAAIDGIQLMRESRLEKLTEKMNEEARAARSNASSTRSSRTSSRSRRGSSTIGTGSRTSRYSSRSRGQTEENGTATTTRRRR